MKYLYGMRLRGFSPGAQPKGVTSVQDDKQGRYWDVLVYARKLTEQEVRDYELDYLDYLGEENE